MFQDFYRKAESQISTHIAALASKISREKPSKSPKKDPGQGEQQMLTALEISDRKKARRMLEQKRVALEEAVERAVCEKVYFKIWHHRSAEDEEGDQKLRSRIAALSLIGIGLKELVVSGSDDVSEEVRRKAVEQEDKIRESLAAARTSIRDMSREKYPLGKLNHLTSAHKSIVETLSNFFPSSSSADEILPTLIYTLITSPPDEVNVVSDLHFIQRFRAQGKIDGEAAYCLVNLEAAVSFLETVELPTLRADEPLEGPEKSTDPSRKRDSTPMELGIAPAPNPDAQLEAFPSLTPVSSTTSLSTKPLPQARSPRRLSQLIAAQTNRLEAAGDSLRGAVLDSADHAVGAINTTLESSFRFLFGRIRASQNQASASADGVGTDIPNPKTLEDARKLVSAPSTPVLRHRLGEDAGASDPATPPSDDGARFPAAPTPRADPTRAAGGGAGGGARMLDLVGGRRPARDRSADSSASGGSAAPGAPGAARAVHGRADVGAACGAPSRRRTAAPGGEPRAVAGREHGGAVGGHEQRCRRRGSSPRRCRRIRRPLPPPRRPRGWAGGAGERGGRVDAQPRQLAEPAQPVRQDGPLRPRGPGAARRRRPRPGAGVESARHRRPQRRPRCGGAGARDAAAAAAAAAATARVRRRGAHAGGRGRGARGGEAARQVRRLPGREGAARRRGGGAAGRVQAARGPAGQGPGAVAEGLLGVFPWI